VRGLEHVRVLPAAAPLAPLLAASRAVVTVNSTVALDAAVLGVPALVVGLPNNLSPFVDARIMVGAGPAEAADALRRILYDEEFRHRLNARRQAYLSRFQIRSDGQAAERTADAVLRLVDGMAPAADR
jgi:UDP-N-acetylglucosamine 2-epimerase